MAVAHRIRYHQQCTKAPIRHPYRHLRQLSFWTLHPVSITISSKLICLCGCQVGQKYINKLLCDNFLAQLSTTFTCLLELLVNNFCVASFLPDFRFYTVWYCESVCRITANNNSIVLKTVKPSDISVFIWNSKHFLSVSDLCIWLNEFKFKNIEIKISWNPWWANNGQQSKQ